jgi:PAS domain S-box-containing protein
MTNLKGRSSGDGVRRKSLAAQLTWLSILVVTVTVLAVGAGLIFIAAKNQRVSAFRLQQLSAEQVSRLISSYIGGASGRLRFFLDNTPLVTLPLHRQKTALENLLITSMPLFSQVTFLDEKGNETIKVSRFHTYLSEELINQADSEAFNLALKGGTYVGPVSFLGNTGLLSVTLAMPVKAPTAEISGVLIAAVNVSHLWQEVSNIKIGKTGYAYLVDMNGHFVAYQKLAKVLQRHGEDMRRMLPVADFIASRRDSIGRVHEYVGLVGEEVIGVYAPVAGTSWAVVIEQPTREAYASIINMGKYLLALAFAGIVAAGVLGFLISRRIVGPIRALTAAARQFGAGDLETEFVGVKRQDEVGVLSNAFQIMQKRLHDLYDGLKRKLAELEAMQKALHESEEKYRSIFENATEGIFQTSPAGRILSVNPAFIKMLGYDSRRDLMLGVKDISAELYARSEDREEILKIIERDGAIEEQEVELRHKGGGGIHCSMNAHAVRDGTGDIIYFEGTVKDITLKKRAEEERESAWSMLEAAINQSPSGIVIADAPDGTIRLANPQAMQIRGASKQSLVNIDFSQHSANWQIFLPDGAPCPPEDLPLTKAITKGETTVNQAMIIRNQQGEDRWIFVNAAPIKNKVGEITSGIVVFQDVTGLKQAEDAKGKLEAQLRQAQKMEAIGTLAGGIAHDFNNILSAIMGYGELAQLAAGNGEDSSRFLDQIVKAAERARGLVKQMLTFSRRSETELSPVNINELVSHSVMLLKHTIPKMIDIQTNLSNDPQLVEADATQIEQVIMNLANNAADAMPDGGKLVFETKAVSLDEEYVENHLEIAPGSYVLLSVTDTGQGMDANTLVRIFDPFFTTKEIGKGTGLGLSSVFGIIKEHGGHISCYSEPGLGATFKIHLPAMKASLKDMAKQDLSAQAVPGGHEKLLLVDDEDAIRGFGAEVLEGAGYHVALAASGEEALELYGRIGAEIDLVILDLGMPGMGGHKCIKELLALNPGVKVLIASGYSATGKVADTIKQGAAGYIAKPFRRIDLLHTVRKVMDG